MNKSIFPVLTAALVALVATAEPRPDLVTKVQSGALKEARASWWGFNREDSTKFLQAAIDSRVPLLRGFQLRCRGNSWLPLPVEGEDLGVPVKDYRRVTR